MKYLVPTTNQYIELLTQFLTCFIPFQNINVEIMIQTIAYQSTTMLSTMEILTISIIDVLQRVVPNPFEQDAYFAVSFYKKPA